METDKRYISQASQTLIRKTSENDDSDRKEERKKGVVRDIIKKAVSKRKKGSDNFDPEPEMSETDTFIKT